MSKERCPCPGPTCGDQTYGQMLAAMKDRYFGANVTNGYLTEIHLKWKKIASRL